MAEASALVCLTLTTALNTCHTLVRHCTIELEETYAGADPGEVKWVNFHSPFSEPPSFFFFFLIPQILK